MWGLTHRCGSGVSAPGGVEYTDVRPGSLVGIAVVHNSTGLVRFFETEYVGLALGWGVDKIYTVCK